MRKVLFATICLTALAASSFGQRFTAGFKAGVSSTTFGGDYTFKESSTMDNSNINEPTVGIFGSYKLTSFFSIQAEASYLTKGFDYQTKGSVNELVNALPQYYNSYSGSMKLSYLEVPILAKFEIGNTLKLFANAGPSMNIVLGKGDCNHKTTSNSSGTLTTVEKTLNLKSSFNKVVLGAIASVGVSYDITPRIGCLAECRISYDLTRSIPNKLIVDNPNMVDVPTYSIEFRNFHFTSYAVQGGLYYKF
jgi:hypothetical protein